MFTGEEDKEVCLSQASGDMASAKLRLCEAFWHDKSLRLTAVEDADLEPLGTALGRIGV